jgi:DNA-binding transcriptional LysR family regulator
VLREPLILPVRTATLRRAFDELMERRNLSGKVRLKAEFTTPELCVEAVRSGLGVALTNIATRFGRTLKDVAKICPPAGLPKLEVAVLCRGDRYLPRYMRAFAGVASAVLKREVERNPGTAAKEKQTCL